MSKIVCKLCNKEYGYQSFSEHLKYAHFVAYKDYVKSNLSEFPLWKICPICKDNITKGTTCSRVCDKLWRKTLIGSKSPHYGCKNTQETKDKLSKIHTEIMSHPKNRERMVGDNNPAHRLEVRKKISETRLARGCGIGEKNGMFGKTHTPEAVKKIFSHKKMNKFERRVADLLIENGIEYQFQYFINVGEVCKSYDFKIKDKPFLIEADGDFWHGNPTVKYKFDGVDKVQQNDILKEKMANERGLTVIRIWESELKTNPQIFIDKLKVANLIGE